MSELINNAAKRKELLKHLIMQINKGEAPAQVKKQLSDLLGRIPYADVVEVEQELLSEGLSQDDILKLCDLHSQALKGVVEQKDISSLPKGHPVHTFLLENQALKFELGLLNDLYAEAGKIKENGSAAAVLNNIREKFNALMDVEKHYQRKENLLFPFLEKHGITGPSKVMWEKHDEARGYLKSVFETLKETGNVTPGELSSLIDLVFKNASDAISEMIFKEEEILFPMSLDTLSEEEFFEIYKQSLEYGFCLYDPADSWKPEGIKSEEEAAVDKGRIQLPSGSFNLKELELMLNSIPFDMTFVDRDDTVRYFTQGKERIFARSRAIIGRKVQHCHPPSSVDIVQKILDDFHSGKEDHAAFWITMKDKFIHIEYFALRNEKREFLGTLEVSQDLTDKRKLQGEQRLLKYSER